MPRTLLDAARDRLREPDAWRPPGNPTRRTRVRFGLPLTVLLLVGAPALYAPGAAVETPIVYLSYMSGGLKYTQVTHAQGDASTFYESSFENTPWPEGIAPFGFNDAGCITRPITNWDSDTDLLLVQSVNIPVLNSAVRIHVRIDDAVQVYVNGQEITNGLTYNYGCGKVGADDFVFEVPPGVIVAGDNVIHVRARDIYRNTYFDLQMDTLRATGPVPPPIPGGEHLYECAGTACVKVVYESKQADLYQPTYTFAGTISTTIERGLVKVSGSFGFVSQDIVVARANGLPDPSLLNRETGGITTNYTYTNAVCPNGICQFSMGLTADPNGAKAGEVWNARLRHYVDGEQRSDLPFVAVWLA